MATDHFVVVPVCVADANPTESDGTTDGEHDAFYACGGVECEDGRWSIG